MPLQQKKLNFLSKNKEVRSWRGMRGSIELSKENPFYSKTNTTSYCYLLFKGKSGG
jgi:hypothetical protein